MAVFQGQFQHGGCPFGGAAQGRVFCLGQIHHLFVMGEIGIVQFRVPVQSQRFPDQRIELPCDEVCQVEGGEFFVRPRRKQVIAIKI